MPEQSEPPPPRDLAPALTRGIRILDLVAKADRPPTMAQIAREFGLAKSSVHALCTTLVAAGFLERAESGTFRLGLRLVDLANARLEDSDLPAEFYAGWDRLSLFRQEAAVLAVRDHGDVVYIACRNSTLPLGVTFRIGMRLPACCTATGKALLSTLPDDAIRALYREHPLATPTRSSVRSVEELLRQLRTVRERGFSIDDGETREHMWSLGAPIQSRETRYAVAAVAVSFLRSDFTKKRADEVANVVRDFAADLSRTQGSVETPEAGIL